MRQLLSPLEHQVMAVVWKRGGVTAGDVRIALPKALTDATVRTLLRRLEAKGYLRHSVRGRTYVYEPRVAESQAAVSAVRRLVQRFFGGSPARLLVGLVDEGLIAPEEVRDLSRRIRHTGRSGRKGRHA